MFRLVVLLVLLAFADVDEVEEEEASVGFLSPIMPTPCTLEFKLAPKRLELELIIDLRIRLSIGLPIDSNTGSYALNKEIFEFNIITNRSFKNNAGVNLKKNLGKVK